MKLLRILFLLAALILAVTARPQRTNGTTAPNAPETQQSQPPPTVASALERDISAIEKQIVDAAEAMPFGVAHAYNHYGQMVEYSG
jgi:hypothetical protein